jgi:hypothetical protein
MELLLGIAKTSGHVKLLLDIERVLTRDDATALSEAAQAA